MIASSHLLSEERNSFSALSPSEAKYARTDLASQLWQAGDDHDRRACGSQPFDLHDQSSSSKKLAERLSVFRVIADRVVTRSLDYVHADELRTDCGGQGFGTVHRYELIVLGDQDQRRRPDASGPAHRVISVPE